MKPSWKLALALVAAGTLATTVATAAVAQQRLFFGIATGGTGGTYYPLGGMLAQLISNKATVVDGKKISATAEAAGASVATPSCWATRTSNRPSSPPTSWTPPTTARASSTARRSRTCARSARSTPRRCS
jgi:hypothetical protein